MGPLSDMDVDVYQEEEVGVTNCCRRAYLFWLSCVVITGVLFLPVSFIILHIYSRIYQTHQPPVERSAIAVTDTDIATAPTSAKNFSSALAPECFRRPNVRDQLSYVQGWVSWGVAPQFLKKLIITNKE